MSSRIQEHLRDHKLMPQVLTVIHGESSLKTAHAARELGYALQDREDDDEMEPGEHDVRKVCDLYMAELITSLVQMLVDEDRLKALDEYTFLLTALRQYSGASKRIANQLVLQATPLLLKPFQIGYAADPNGYTAPELVSMWSSVLNDVGRAQCLSAMTCLVPAVQPCIRSDTVGSAVAALLIANLVGHRDDSREIFQHAVTGMCAALDAAFNGDEYAERKWGPGPVTKGFASITVADSNKELVYGLNLMPQFAAIIERGREDWPVAGFDDEYYMGAKASACRVVWNLALKYDVEAQCENIMPVIEGFLSCTGLSAVARSNAECAAFAVATFREAAKYDAAAAAAAAAGAGAGDGD